MTDPRHAASPVESYLDDLLVELSGRPRQALTGASLPPREVRRQLAEAEDHLRESTVAGLARGLAQHDAEAEAIERFGPPGRLAEAEAHRLHRPVRAIVTGCVISGWWLGALAAVAVGLSGVLAAVGTALWGQTFTVGRPSGSVLTAANCARWMANTHAKTCIQAATADWASETTVLRVAFGMLGALALASWALWRRRRSGPRVRVGARVRVGLPAAVVDTIGVTCFGAAGVWLTGQTIDTAIVASGRGAGQWLSAAPVAVGLAALFAARLLRDLRAGELMGGQPR